MAIVRTTDDVMDKAIRVANGLIYLLIRGKVVNMVNNTYCHYIRKLKKEGFLERNYKPKRLKRRFLIIITEESHELSNRIFFELIALASYGVLEAQAPTYLEKDLINVFTDSYVKETKRLIAASRIEELEEIMPAEVGNYKHMMGQKLNIENRIEEYIGEESGMLLLGFHVHICSAFEAPFSIIAMPFTAPYAEYVLGAAKRSAERFLSA